MFNPFNLINPSRKKDFNPDKKILDYVKSNLKKGFSQDSIKLALINGGRSSESVDLYLDFIRTQKRKRTIYVLLCLFVLVISSICLYYFFFNQKFEDLIDDGNILCTEERYGDKTIIFVLGGGDWRIIEVLLKENRLKNLEYLKENGVYGKLKSVKPIYSSVNTASLFTGKTPDKHGLDSHFKFLEGNTTAQLYRDIFFPWPPRLKT